MKDAIIISLGGSLIVPGEIDIDFLKKFKKMILKHIKKGKKFFLICGGGKTCRKYNAAAKALARPTHLEMDWMGIQTTKVNAHLVKILFKDYAYPEIIDNPNKKIKISNKHKIFVAGGWKPGCTTDKDAVLIAKNFKVKQVINLTDLHYAYTADPKLDKNAKKLEKVSWKEFRKIVGNKWIPGINKPFDPVASREAQRLKLTVITTQGKDLKNLDNIISGKKKFKATVIS
ncbi:MAG: UMP kinase [archaeon]